MNAAFLSLLTAMGVRVPDTESIRFADKEPRRFTRSHTTRSPIQCPACWCNPSLKDFICRNRACRAFGQVQAQFRQEKVA